MGTLGKEGIAVVEGDVYQVIIVGGGPAGLTAGLYTTRSRLGTLLIETGLFGGQVTNTDLIENYPGFPEGVTGEDLARLMEEQAKRFGLETVNQHVIEIGLEGHLKVVKTHEGTYRAKTLILCTGAEYQRLGIPGEKEFSGRGVSYCSTCDGAFFKERKVLVVGGGDSALSEALYLTRFVSELTIVHRRDALRATKIYQERALAHSKISFLWNSAVQEIRGDQVVRSALVKNLKTGHTQEIETEGAFIFIGIAPRTDLVRGLVEMDEMGYIATNANCETSVRGIFAAGDCRRQLLRQITTAVGAGSIAAFAAEKYLEEME
jgi:thioredoxin reductase (NADPH)